MDASGAELVEVICCKCLGRFYIEFSSYSLARAMQVMCPYCGANTEAKR